MKKIRPKLGALGACVMAVLVAGGCQPGTGPTPPRGDGDPRRDTARSVPLAFINGQRVAWSDLAPATLEAAGGEALFHLVLDRAIGARLAERGLTLTAQDVAAERAALLRSLDAENPDQAVRLLRELRVRRGLGPQRFEALLRRNAGLRKLATRGGEPTVSDAELRTAYETAYGAQVQVRLALLDTLAEARRFRAEVAAAPRPESRFIELAVDRSIDPSASRGGLLAPVSVADAAYPPAFRQALASWLNEPPERGIVSRAVALESGVAVMQFVRVVPAREVPLASVEAELRKALRRRKVREAMDRLAESLVAESEVVVLDDTLGDAWDRRGEIDSP